MHAEALATTAGVRHGTARWSLGDWWHGLKTGEHAGAGMALRRTQGTIGFGRMLARQRGALLVFLWFLLGAALAVATRVGGPFVVWGWATVGVLAFFSVLRWSVRRPFFGGLTLLAQGLFIARQLALPFGRARLGTPPRPIVAPQARTAVESPSAGEVREVPNPFERALPRDPGEPPPLVGGR
jgi:hypothetical protein